MRTFGADPQRTIDHYGMDTVLVDMAATVAWAVLAWLAVSLLVLAAAEAPGRVGSIARTVSRRMVPGTTRRLLASAVGITLFSTVQAPVALASPSPLDPPVPRSALVPELDWPVSPQRRGHRPATTPDTDSTVTVAPGDTLWTIAAGHLARESGSPRTASPSTDDTSVAQEWPRWWSRNRAVIGNDPDLIRPGQRLDQPDRLS